MAPEQTAVANLQTPSLTQAIAFALLDAWGYDAFVAHTIEVSQFYKGKRDVFERHMKKHLDGLAQWDTPEAGMFFWFKLLLNDPSDPTQNAVEEDSEDIIRDKAFKNGVLALPGTVFNQNGGKSAYVRASFSLLTPEDVEEAVKRLARTIKEARGL